MNSLVITPESFVGQWMLLRSNQVFRVKKAYYGVLTRSEKDSIDVLDARGNRGVIFVLSHGGLYQTHVGDFVQMAPVRKVMRQRRAWWGFWSAAASVPFSVAAVLLYLATTPHFFALPGDERFVFLGTWFAILGAAACAAGLFGAALPRKPDGPPGSGVKNMKRM